MKKFLDKININKIIIVYILIQPIIDVITSLLVRYVSETLTFGIIIRTLFMIGIAIYAIIKAEKKDRVRILIYYALIAIYLLSFLVNCYLNYGMSGILTQIKGIVKTFYLPIILVALIPILKQSDTKIDNKPFIYALFGYGIVILISSLLKIDFSTYEDKDGTVGLFYAANEIGAILTCLAPILVINLFKGEKSKIFNFITLFLYVYSILQMGTKVPLFGALGLSAIAILICVIKCFTKERKEYIKKGLITLCVVLISLVIVPYSPVGRNIEIANGISLPRIFDFNKNKPVEETPPEEEEPADSIVSGRDIYLKDNLELYKKAGLMGQALGIGYVKGEKGSVEAIKLVEMDYFDIAICGGIVGFTVYFIPFLYIGICALIGFFKNIKQLIFKDNIWLEGYSIAISLIIALLAGHVLTSPAIGIFISIIMLEFCDKTFGLKKLK